MSLSGDAIYSYTVLSVTYGVRLVAVGCKGGSGPHRARLNDRAIATAALAVIDAHGIDGFTIRRLATELGAAPMAIYHHFADKEAVLEAVAQLLLAKVEPPPAELGWCECAHHMLGSLRALVLAHPNAAPLLGRFPPRSPDALAFIEAGLRTFRAAGFDVAAAARIYRALAAYFLGTLQIELAGYFTAYPAANQEIARYLPTVREVAPVLAAHDDDREFGYGLDLLLSGLAGLREPENPGAGEGEPR